MIVYYFTTPNHEAKLMPIASLASLKKSFTHLIQSSYHAIKHPNTHKQNLFIYVLLPVFTYLSMFALGRGNVANLGYSLSLFLTLYVLRVFSNRLFLIYAWMTFVVSFLYFPQGIIYGEINLGIVISFYETNTAETIEYFQNMSAIVYLCALTYGLSFYFLLKISKRITTIKTNKKWYYFLAFIVVFAAVHRPIKFIYQNGSVTVNEMSSIKTYPLKFFFKYWKYHNHYFLGKSKLDESQKYPSTWEITHIAPKYKNYVLVIGESARKDYMSFHDYPVDTSPFLSKVKGTIFNNYISPSYNTALSLKRTFIEQPKKEQFIYPNTIMTLAKQAKFKTYWISNQGRMGEYDTLASSIGLRSDSSYFTKIGGYTSNNKSDLELLPEFRKALSASKSSNKHQLIILHLVGSHASFCERLDEAYQITNFENIISSDLSCYLSSLLQTDRLLQRIYNDLQDTKESFSMIYFSDHGLTKAQTNLKEFTLKHNDIHRQNYEVPFLKMSSDDTERTIINAQKSGYDFLKGFSEWLGVKTVNFKNKPAFFSDQKNGPIEVFNGNDVVDYDSLADDPVMLPE